jgi:hypothetical protein
MKVALLLTKNRNHFIQFVVLCIWFFFCINPFQANFSTGQDIVRKKKQTGV